MTDPNKHAQLVLLVCGSRDWTDCDMIRDALTRCHEKHEIRLIIHGGCRGADKLAGVVSFELGIELAVFPADWEQYGKAAGPRRNREMLAQKPDWVLAFHSDWKRSKGTKDMIEAALAAGVPVVVFDSTGNRQRVLCRTPSDAPLCS